MKVEFVVNIKWSLPWACVRDERPWHKHKTKRERGRYVFYLCFFLNKKKEETILDML